MKMDDVDEETFGQLVHWLYTQKIERCNYDDMVLLGKLWILAERCLMPILQNNAMDTIYPLLQGTVIAGDKSVEGLLNLIYGDAQEEYTLLRKLLVDHFALAPSHRITFWADFLPQKLLAELTKTLSNRYDVLRSGRDQDNGEHEKTAADYYVGIPEKMQKEVIDLQILDRSTDSPASRKRSQHKSIRFSQPSARNKSSSEAPALAIIQRTRTDCEPLEIILPPNRSSRQPWSYFDPYKSRGISSTRNYDSTSS